MKTYSLDVIDVARPCEMDWNDMRGDQRVRFCGHCSLHVYNLSEMPSAEAHRLVSETEGRLCVRFYKRRDGSVITGDCPVGWARVKQRARVLATAAFSMLIALFSGVFIVSLFSKARSTTIMGEMAVPITTSTPKHTMGAVSIRPEPNFDGDQIMGKMRIEPHRR